jgi:hypothetical protein
MRCSILRAIVGIYYWASTAERGVRSRLIAAGAHMAPSFNLPLAVPITLIFATLVVGYAISFAVYRAFS